MSGLDGSTAVVLAGWQQCWIEFQRRTWRLRSNANTQCKMNGEGEFWCCRSSWVAVCGQDHRGWSCMLFTVKVVSQYDSGTAIHTCYFSGTLFFLLFFWWDVSVIVFRQHGYTWKWALPRGWQDKSNDSNCQNDVWHNLKKVTKTKRGKKAFLLCYLFSHFL